MKITKKQKYIIAWGGGLLLVSIAIAVPLIVQSTKKNTTSFNLSIIKRQMQIATKRKASLAETKVAIVNMYQNGTTQKLSLQAQKATQVLAQYIYANKTRKKFAFVLGKDYQDQQLLLLTIANHPSKTKNDVSLLKGIQQAPTSTQKQEDPFLVKQLWWVARVLQKAEFGILFWIYQHRLSGQEALPGTSKVLPSITAINFQRVKTAHEQLQDQVWIKIAQVIQNLTSRQLKIHGDVLQLPSQTKITASHIMLAIQNIITSDDEISKVVSKLMKEDNIKVQLVDKTGAIIITIKNYGHDKIMTIFGFKAIGTPLDIAQAKINAAQDGASLPTKSNEVTHGQTPSALDVNVPTKNGVTFRFKSATVVNNKGESTLTYEVDASPQVENTITKEVTFIVGGFETQVQARERIAAQAKINVAQAKIGVTSPTKFKQVFHGQTPTASDVNAPLKNGVTFKLQSATAVNNKGESTFTYEVDVNPQVEGTTPQDVTFVVSGFETKDQKDARERIAAQVKINAAQNKIGVTSPTRLNQVSHGQTPTALDVNAPLKDGVTFKLQLATAVNNQGESTLTYEVDVNPQVKGTTPQDVTFDVSGFETQAQARERIVVQAKINAAQNKIGVTSPTRLNQVFHGQIPTALDVNAPTKNGVIFRFKLATAINDQGESTLTYEVDANPQVEGTTPQDVTFVISGFETNEQKDAREVIKKRLDTIMQNINYGALVIPQGITTRQFDEYVQAMGDVLNGEDEFVMNKFAEQYRAKITSLTIPNSFTTIGSWFHHFIKITSLRIPDSVTTIGDLAFNSSPLTTLKLGEALKTIGDNAFRSAQLTSLTIPDSVTTIGDWAFWSAPLTTLKLGEALKTIGDYAFYKAKLTLLTIPNSVTTIGESAFKLSPLTTLSLGDALKTIEDNAFRSAQLTSLTIPDSVTTIGAFAFYNSPLTSLTLGEALKTIGWYAFRRAQLTSLRIPNSVTTIASAAFISCPLKEITIFQDVTLGISVFKETVKIKKISRPTKPSL